MTFQGETLFALIRRRESIRALAQQQPLLLPSSLTGKAKESLSPSAVTSAQQLQKDLLTLEAKKKKHLAVTKHRGGKKLNRLSYIGLFIGLLILGGLFFIAGYFMCLSLNPPYGGVIFDPKYATASPGRPLTLNNHSDRTLSEEDMSVRPDVPRKSYVDRQALIARATDRPEKPGLLEKAEERTFDNVKSQIKDNVTQGVRNLSQKLSNKLGSNLGNIVSPLIQDLPQDIAADSVDNTFDQLSSQDDASGFTFQEERVNQIGKSPSPKEQKAKEIGKSVNIKNSAPLARQSNLYALRIHRFAERDSALKLAEELRRKGYDGYIIPLWDEKGQLDFEVRSGSYATYAEAQTALKVLQQIWNGPGVELPHVVMTRHNEEQIRP